jgi:hypothetical protein
MNNQLKQISDFKKTDNVEYNKALQEVRSEAIKWARIINDMQVEDSDCEECKISQAKRDGAVKILKDIFEIEELEINQ